MVTLDELMDTDDARTRAGSAAVDTARLLGAGLYWTGWALAKTIFLVLLALGGALYGIGWVARRVVWPALLWMGTAVKLGWEDGRRGSGRSAPRSA